MSELCITWHKFLFLRGEDQLEGGCCRTPGYTPNTTIIKGTLNYSLQTLLFSLQVEASAEQAMACSVSSCKMPNLKVLLAFFPREISMTIRLPNCKKDSWFDENEEIQQEERTSLVRATSFQSMVMLNTHCTFLKAGHRAHLQNNHQQMTMFTRAYTQNAKGLRLVN